MSIALDIAKGNTHKDHLMKETAALPVHRKTLRSPVSIDVSGRGDEPKTSCSLLGLGAGIGEAWGDLTGSSAFP
jgi:hypothetical protein